jgi:hypothetical protein
VPPHWKWLLNRFKLDIDPNEGAFDFDLGATFQRIYDPDNTVIVDGFRETAGTGGFVGYVRSFGQPLGRFTRQQSLGLFVGAEDLGQDFASAESGFVDDEGVLARYRLDYNYTTILNRVDLPAGWDNEGTLEYGHSLGAGDFMGKDERLFTGEYAHRVIRDVDVNFLWLGLARIRDVDLVGFADTGAIGQDVQDIVHARNFMADAGLGLRIQYDLFGLVPSVLRLDLAHRVDDWDADQFCFYISARQSF